MDVLRMPGAWPTIPEDFPVPDNSNSNLDTLSLQAPPSACTQVFHIYELAQLIFNNIDDGIDLWRAQKTCKLFNQHARILKQDMTRCDKNEHKVIETPTTDTKFNGYLSIFKRLFKPLPAAVVPKRINGASLFLFQRPPPAPSQYRYSSFHIRDDQIPKNLDQSPWNIFISQPPISSAHLLEPRKLSHLQRGFTRKAIYAPQGVTIGDILSLMQDYRSCDTRTPFMIVLGNEAKTVRAAEKFIEMMGRRYIEREKELGIGGRWR